MQSNKTILLGGIVIITMGALYAATNNKPETPVFAGGIGVMLLASLLDMAGGIGSKVATGLVGLGVLTSVLVEGPSLFNVLTHSQGLSSNPDTLTNTQTKKGH